MAPALDIYSIASWTAALLAALSGSLHCLGMCGPIRLMAPERRWAYQLGRLSAYLLLGGITGLLGAALPSWASLAVVGLCFVVYFLPIKLPAKIRTTQVKILQLAAKQPFFLGMGSGLLPCGMLHAWLAVAVASRSPVIGSALMGVLWLGTLPALEAGAGVLRKPVTLFRSRFPRFAPFLFLLLALLPVALRAQMAVSPEKAPAHCQHHMK